MESSKLWLHPGVTCAAGYFYIFHLIWYFFHRLWLLPDLLPVKGTVHSKLKMRIFLSTFGAFYPSRLFWFEVRSFGYIGGREVCFHWCFLFYFVELLFVCRVVTSHFLSLSFPTQCTTMFHLFMSPSVFNFYLFPSMLSACFVIMTWWWKITQEHLTLLFIMINRSQLTNERFWKAFITILPEPKVTSSKLLLLSNEQSKTQRLFIYHHKWQWKAAKV